MEHLWNNQGMVPGKGTRKGTGFCVFPLPRFPYCPLQSAPKLLSQLLTHGSTLFLQGYAVGNGCTDERFDGNAIIPFTHGMGLIDDDLYQVTPLALFPFRFIV